MYKGFGALQYWGLGGEEQKKRLGGEGRRSAARAQDARMAVGLPSGVDCAMFRLHTIRPCTAASETTFTLYIA